MRTPIVYPFVRDVSECERLVLQGEFFADGTERFLREAGVATARRVLDFGCGSGAVVELLRRLCAPDAAIVAYDPSPATLAFARRHLRLRGVRRVQFATQLPHGRFDAIVLRMVLMYAPNPIRLLKRLRRLLRPGGLLAVQESDHGDYMETTPPSELFATWRRRIMAAGVHCGVRVDTHERLPGLLATAGFVQVRECTPCARREQGPDSPLYGILARTASGMAAAMQRAGVLRGHVPLDLAEQLRAAAVTHRLTIGSSRLVGVVGRRP